MIAELQSALQGQEVGLPLLRTTLLKPHKEVLLGPEWVGSQSWVHSELAGSSEVQWPALLLSSALSGADKGTAAVWRAQTQPTSYPWRPLLSYA